MECPVCGERLKEVDRSGVLVDICPACKGCWLDRGELDKLLAMESGVGQAGQTERWSSNNQGEYRDRDDHGHDHDDHDRGHHEDGNRHSDNLQGKKTRKSSLLGDILGGFGGD